MSTKKLKILLKSWILAISFYSFLSCGKEGLPHPPFPKEKLVKDVNFKQEGDKIIIALDIPEIFLEGKISIYFIKTKNTQKKEIPMPPSEAIFKKKNLILEKNLNEKKFKMEFEKETLGLDYNYSTFWGFILKGKKVEEKTKIFQFLYLEKQEKPLIESVNLEEDGILFKLKIEENCNNLLIKKELENGIPIVLDLKKRDGNLFIDENVFHNRNYRYSFYCYKEDKNHLSEPSIYKIKYKYEFKPKPPEDVMFLEEKENLRIEFKKVERATKYKVYEKCPFDENWKLIMETEKNILFFEKKFCKFGVSSINEAGLESEIIEAKEY